MVRFKFYGAGFLGAGSAESVTLTSSSTDAASGFFRLIKWLISLALAFGCSVMSLEVLDEATSPAVSPPINAPIPPFEIKLIRN